MKTIKKMSDNPFGYHESLMRHEPRVHNPEHFHFRQPNFSSAISDNEQVVEQLDENAN